MISLPRRSIASHTACFSSSLVVILYPRNLVPLARSGDDTGNRAGDEPVLGIPRAQLFQVLISAVIVLFLSGNFVSSRYRGALRGVTIGLYAAAAVLALAWIGIWLAGD